MKLRRHADWAFVAIIDLTAPRYEIAKTDTRVVLLVSVLAVVVVTRRCLPSGVITGSPEIAPVTEMLAV